MLDVETTAAELAALFGTGRTAAPLTAAFPDFDLPAAYQVAEAVRIRRLGRDGPAVGRKIGFTNYRMWQRYEVKAPIWGHMYQNTVQALADSAEVSLDGFPEPKIEPEIVFKLGTAPQPGMDDAALLGCIEWAALGFEFVSSIYPRWQFKAADAVAAYGVHFGLRMGESVPVAAGSDWLRQLASFQVDLFRDGDLVASGGGADVLGSPLSALRHLNDLLVDRDYGPPLNAGEIITTGTLTLAMPAGPGETWRAEPRGIGLQCISVDLL